MLTAALVFALSALGPYSASSNFTVDLMGTADTRPATWGDAGVQTWNVRFNPPAGYRVRIVTLKGDLVAWPKVLPGDTPVAPGLVSGLLLGFQTTAAQGSIRCNPCADNTMLYIQDAVGGYPEKTRAAYEYDVRAGGLLEPDNVLVVVVANWLNVTGKYIHIEPTFVVTYRFEKEQ